MACLSPVLPYYSKNARYCCQTVLRENIIDRLGPHPYLHAMTNRERALRDAVKEAGSLSELARRTGMSRQRLHHMIQKAKQASPAAVIPIERATGVSRSRLRPDLYPEA